MQGKIKAYSPAVKAGLVEGVDGQNYPFNHKQWAGEGPPSNNQTVKLETKENRLIKVLPE